MIRSRSALLATVASAALLAGCGTGDASQDGVHSDVEEILTEDGYVDPAGERVDLSAEEADEAASCVARALFESDGFTKDERNDIARASDGDPPSEELAADVVELVNGCVGDALGSGGAEETDAADE
jgi:hypothetical protein